MNENLEEVILLHEKLILYKMMDSLEDSLSCLEKLNKADFVDFHHANLFTEILNTVNKDKKISSLAIRRNLTDEQDIRAFDEIKEVKEEAKLKDLEGLTSYVIEQSKLRALEDLSKETVSELSQGLDSDTISNRLMGGLISLNERDAKFELETIYDLLPETEAYLKTNPGLKIGLKDFDDLTGGFKRKELTVIGGRAAMGKSLMALWSAYNIAKQGIPVAFFSIEMSKEDLMCRLLSDKANVMNWKLTKRQLSPKDLEAIRKEAPKILKDVPLFINDRSDITVNQIISKCISLKMKHGDLGAIFIDFIQLMKMPRGQFNEDNKAYLIGENSKMLKGLAKDLNASAVLLSQVKREVETRQDKRPMNSDLSESGNLEQQAGLIVFPFRPYVYSKDKGEEKECEIIVTKNRHGEIGTVYCTADLNYQRFENKPAII